MVWEEWQSVAATSFFGHSMQSGRIVVTDVVDPAAAHEAGLRQEWAGVLRQQTIPWYADYAVDYFEKALDVRCHIPNTLTLSSGTRILYYATLRKTH